MTEIRVLIVEDEPLIAEDIAKCLNNIDYKSAGIAYTAEKALELLHSRQPDIVLLDIQIKGTLSGIDIGRIIHEKYHIPFIYLTSYSDKKTVDEAKKTMPYSYILKPFSEMELFTSLEVALYRFAMENKGEFPELATVNQRITQALTGKEYEVLRALCQGCNNKQISEQQFISINTVKTHVRQLLIKLNVPNRTSAMRFIYAE